MDERREVRTYVAFIIYMRPVTEKSEKKKLDLVQRFLESSLDLHHREIWMLFNSRFTYPQRRHSL